MSTAETARAFLVPERSTGQRVFRAKQKIAHARVPFRVLTAALPDEPEALGVLAPMPLHDARRDSRTDAAGDLVTLADQDRSRWDRERIAEGVALCERALRHRRAGLFQLQAAIAACHATRADLLRRVGRAGEAADSYRLALDLAPTDAERRFLRGRLDLCWQLWLA